MRLTPNNRRAASKMIPISKKLLKVIGKTNGEFRLIGEGDKILVGLSGGKDSLALVHAMKHIQRHAPFNFEFEACTIKYEVVTVHTVIISYVAIGEHSSLLFYFSRMRRGALYTFAEEGRFNKVALGHHFDDTVESFFMNMFYNGSMRALAPIYKTSRGFHLIRPLIQVRESQLRGFAEDNNLQVIGNEACPAMLKDVKMPHARASTKAWLAGLEADNKDIFKMFKASFKHIYDDTFLDPERWDRDDISVSSEQ